jgi:sugar O-acyltransferase (sialic acid O-acetyltransferase NeuD family)
MASGSKKLVIFGTGEIGMLAKFYFDRDSNYAVVGFTADDEFVSADSVGDLPLVPFSKLKERFPPDEVGVHVALSYKKLNQVRAEKYFAVKSLGYKLPSYVCSKSVYWDDLSIGDNCFILENQTIQPTVKIGNNVMIWSGNHIGHGVVIGDHCYISSHVVIAGHVSIGERSFLGINSAIKDFVSIGADTFVTMNAAVIKDIKAGSVVVASSGRVYKAESEEAKFLKQRYFFT